GPARRPLGLVAGGEPRDDPPAQRRRRALRAARRAASRARRGRARRASHLDARVARRRSGLHAATSVRARVSAATPPRCGGACTPLRDPRSLTGWAPFILRGASAEPPASATPRRST